MRVCYSNKTRFQFWTNQWIPLKYLLWDPLSGLVTFTRPRCKYGRALSFTICVICTIIISCSLTSEDRVFFNLSNCGTLQQASSVHLPVKERKSNLRDPNWIFSILFASSGIQTRDSVKESKTRLRSDRSTSVLSHHYW